MHGNVMEWCEDCYLDDAKEIKSHLKNVHRILRGGCWINNYEQCRSAFRTSEYPNIACCYYGFRVAFSKV